MEPRYAHGGARALVTLHARALRSFVVTWRRARAAELVMPATEDPDCATLDAMLRHVLGAARGYMVWMCEQLGFKAPVIEPVPDDVPDDVEGALEAYVEHLLEGWDGPLVALQPEAADRPAYPSRWGTEYCIDAMLEHAVMHPARHEHQLERLLAGR